MIDTNQEILRPVIALIAWTLVMLVWLMATRLPAMKAAGVDLGELIGGKGTDADGALPQRVQWQAHDHNQLLEQPTDRKSAVLGRRVTVRLDRAGRRSINKNHNKTNQ